MMFRRLLSFCLPLLSALGSCQSDQGPADIADVNVLPASTILTVGETVQLTASATSSDGRSVSLAGRTITWTTTNVEVATVDAAGLVSALSPGRVVIVAMVEWQGGEADVTVEEPTQTDGSTLRIVSGDGQQATVTDTMAAPLVVQLLDPNGAPLPGVVVTFLAAGDTAELTSNFVATDANGSASTIVVLHTHAGPFAVSASTQRAVASVAFSLRALADVPTFSRSLEGDGQNGFIDRPLPHPLVVELNDQFGNQAAGRTVQWVVTGGGGAPASLTTISDASGLASVTWVMGSSPGPNTIEARLLGLPAVAFSALAVTQGPGRITFTRGEGSPGPVLMRMEPDGTQVDTLPGSVPGDFDADWSRDDARLVFANFAANPSRLSGFNSFADIVVMNADGSGRTRLTDHFGSVSGPVWSPDGSKIAFASDQTGRSEIYVMDADGSHVVLLTTTGGFAPSWSPDGSRIVVGEKTTASFDDPPAFIMNASNGQNVVPLAPGEDPVWSPDGTVIAMATCPSPCDQDDYQVSFIHPDGSGLTTATALRGVHQPAWSRDGSKLAVRVIIFPSIGIPAQSNLWSLNADGSGPVQLSEHLTGPGDHLPTWGP
jgi:Big-like domain-containing protein/WD40 repeat protein